MSEKKVKCEKCGKEFYMTNPEAGCPYCYGRVPKSNDSTSIMTKGTNTIANILKVIAWITLVLGFVMGFIVGRDSYDNIEFFSLIQVWIIYTGAFLGVYALGEIIQILHDIRAKLYKK